MVVNVTGFRRRQRLAAQKAAEKAAQEAQDAAQQVAGTNGEGETENSIGETLGTKNDVLNQDEQQQTQDPTLTSYTVEEIDTMGIEQVRAALKGLNVTFPHNTGEEKLKSKLKEVCGHVE